MTYFKYNQGNKMFYKDKMKILTTGKKEFGDEVNVPLFSTTQILSGSLKLEPFVQLQWKHDT